MSNPIDLGRPFLCVANKRLDQTAAYYQKLGFSLRPDDPPVPQVRALRQGPTNFALFDFLKDNSINYRGASIHAMVTELTARGFQCRGHNVGVSELNLMQDDDGNPLPDNEAGHFSVFDPDGYHLFFNTHPFERELYQNNVSAFDIGIDGVRRADDHMAAEVEKGPEGATLGRFIYQINVKDISASRAFYEKLGLRAEAAAGGAFDLTGQHPHMLQDPTAFPIRLRQADNPGNALLFRSGDPVAVAETLRSAGADIDDGSDGPTMTDPNGQRLVLVAA